MRKVKHQGTCINCTTRHQAQKYESDLRTLAKEASKLQSAKEVVERYKDLLTGASPVYLCNAFEESFNKPRARMPSKAKIKEKHNIFNDFLAFMKDHYPDITLLAQVLPKHAEEYVSYIRNNGRFIKTIESSYKNHLVIRRAQPELSAYTLNYYVATCHEVFRIMGDDAKSICNPFDKIPKMKLDHSRREAFSPEDLRKIYDNMDDFTGPLFTVAIMTALREGDICTLRWSDLYLDEGVIRRRMNKTGNVVEIPMSDGLRDFFLRQPHTDNEYVFPEHARMYLKGTKLVSIRIKKFLNRIGIVNRRKVPGRSIMVSTKDLHSCRHTFCYYAGMRGVPLAVVQSIVGHMSPEMTKHYSAHATMLDKKRGIGIMSDLMAPAKDGAHEELSSLINLIDAGK